MKTRRTVATKDHSPLPVLHFGAGRGTRLGLSAYEEFNASSPGGVALTFVDAQPGTALAVVKEAKERGIMAQALEARVEDIIDQLPTSEQTACVVSALDHGEPTAQVIEHTPETIYSIGTLVIKIPGWQLGGLSFCLGPNHLPERPIVARLFRRIGTVTMPRGSTATFGSDGALEDRAGEPFLRAALASRLSGILRKAIARLQPEVNPLELTIDMGQSWMPVFIVERPATWSDPSELAERTIERITHPLMRGESFAIFELLESPIAIRIHIVRLRFDGRVVVEGAAGSIDTASVAREAEQEAQARAAAALARAEKTTLSKTQPVLTTD
jgi:hypothetical protein